MCVWGGVNVCVCIMCAIPEINSTICPIIICWDTRSAFSAAMGAMVSWYEAAPACTAVLYLSSSS